MSLSLPRELLVMAARQKKARDDYHVRTKDSRGEFVKLGDHGRLRYNGLTGEVREVVCGCVECSP